VIAPNQSFFEGDGSSAYIVAGVGGRLRLAEAAGWTIAAAGGLSRVTYFESGGAGAGPASASTDDLRDYSTTVFTPSLAASRRLALAGRPARVAAEYAFRREVARIEGIGLGSHRLTASVGLDVTEKTEIAASASVSKEDFRVTFPDPALNDRDGERWGLGAAATRKIGRRGALARGRYAFAKANVDGRNFEYAGHAVTAEAQAPLGATRLWLAVDGTVDWRNYDGFQSGFVPAPGRTDQTVYATRLRASHPAPLGFEATAFVQSFLYRSNSEQFEGSRFIGGAGLSYRF